MKHKKVKLIRCHIGITAGGMAGTTIEAVKTAGANQAPLKQFDMELTPVGVYMKSVKDGSEHIVPFANIHHIYLESDE